MGAVSSSTPLAPPPRPRNERQRRWNILRAPRWRFLRRRMPSRAVVHGFYAVETHFALLVGGFYAVGTPPESSSAPSTPLAPAPETPEPLSTPLALTPETSAKLSTPLAAKLSHKKLRRAAASRLKQKPRTFFNEAEYSNKTSYQANEKDSIVGSSRHDDCYERNSAENRSGGCRG